MSSNFLIDDPNRFDIEQSLKPIGVGNVRPKAKFLCFSFFSIFLELVYGIASNK